MSRSEEETIKQHHDLFFCSPPDVKVSPKVSGERSKTICSSASSQHKSGDSSNETSSSRKREWNPERENREGDLFRSLKIEELQETLLRPHLGGKSFKAGGKKSF